MQKNTSFNCYIWALATLFCLTFFLTTASSALAGAIRSGFNTNSLPANDDSSSEITQIGFSINYFGTTYDSVYVNNNGNITLGSPLAIYTPEPIAMFKFRLSLRFGLMWTLVALVPALLNMESEW